MKFKSFKNAREYVHGLHLKNEREWILFCKSNNKPKDIPSVPRQYYTKEWNSFGDWLGTYTVAPQNKKFRSFKQARIFARTLKLHNYSQWVKYYKTFHLPLDIPTTPNRTYKNKGWIGWSDWLALKRNYHSEILEFHKVHHTNLNCFLGYTVNSFF